MASKVRTLFVFALGCGVALFCHDLLTLTDHENHVVIFNSSNDSFEQLQLRYTGEISGTWNAELSVSLPGGLSTFNFPRAFSDSGDVLVKHRNGQFHAKIDDMGRFGHTLVIELTDNDIALCWDGVVRPEIRVPAKAK